MSFGAIANVAGATSTNGIRDRLPFPTASAIRRPQLNWPIHLARGIREIPAGARDAHHYIHGRRSSKIYAGATRIESEGERDGSPQLTKSVDSPSRGAGGKVSTCRGSVDLNGNRIVGTFAPASWTMIPRPRTCG
jgi:hypothetical protein